MLHDTNMVLPDTNMVLMIVVLVIVVLVLKKLNFEWVVDPLAF